MKRNMGCYCVLFVGVCLLVGLFSVLSFVGKTKALPLGEVLGEDFEQVVKETSVLLGDFSELKERTTLVTSISTYDFVFYVEVQVVQLWVDPKIFRKWQKLHQPGSYTMELTLERMIPIWRDIAKKFLPIDSSYLYWNYSLKSGWRISILSTLNQKDYHLVPVLVIFRHPRVR